MTMIFRPTAFMASMAAILVSAGCAAPQSAPYSLAGTTQDTKVATAAGATTNKPGYNKDEVVCQRDRVTGSRFARNLCHSREEWERMRTAGVEGAGNIQRAPIPVISE